MHSYCKCDIFCELSDVKVLLYWNLKKIWRMSLIESDRYFQFKNVSYTQMSASWTQWFWLRLYFCITLIKLGCTVTPYKYVPWKIEIPTTELQCVSFILSYLKWLLFPDQKEILYTWYLISLIMSGHLGGCLPRFLAYWKLTKLPAPTKMRKFNEEQRKFIVRIFAIQSSATQVRREFLHQYGIKGGRKRSQFTAKTLRESITTLV